MLLVTLSMYTTACTYGDMGQTALLALCLSLYCHDSFHSGHLTWLSAKQGPGAVNLKSASKALSPVISCSVLQLCFLQAVFPNLVFRHTVPTSF